MKPVYIGAMIALSFIFGYSCKQQTLRDSLARKEIQISNEWERWYKKQIYAAENCEIACPKYIKKYKDTICIYGGEKWE